MTFFKILHTARLRQILSPRTINNNVQNFYSKGLKPKNKITKYTIMSVGLIGIGYFGYSRYISNKIVQSEQPVFLEELPNVKPTRKVIYSDDMSNLKLVLFQYQTCPFCCKVRAFLDYNRISYNVVEVDTVFKQSISWSTYKKVPILLVKSGDGYFQLNDSTLIISILKSYLLNKNKDLASILQYYPVLEYIDDNGKAKSEIVNKYFITQNDRPINEETIRKEIEERKWRKWADSSLMHTLSPNVYKTLGEAVQTFNWFAEAGSWSEHFPGWKVNVMIYLGAFVMWVLSKRLKRKHGLKEDVRQSLYDECNAWTGRLKQKNTPFVGGDSPDLSDLTTYGILSSIEGCSAFVDLREHTSIGQWYDKMKKYELLQK